MGSGINLFTNRIDKTPAGGVNEWTDVDVSGDIPTGSTGAVVILVNISSSSTIEAMVRKKGSSQTPVKRVGISSSIYAYVGVDSNRIFQVYRGSTDIKLYLAGYTDSNVDFFLEPIDKTPASSGAWVDVDASPNIPVGSTGVICLLLNTDVTNDYYVGIRKKGSIDEVSYGKIMGTLYLYDYQLCGVDSNRVFQVKTENKNYAKVRLVGYTKAPVTFFLDSIELGLFYPRQEWLDIPVTEETEATADGVLIHVVIGGDAAGAKGWLRKKGSTDEDLDNITILEGGCLTFAVGIDSARKLQGWINTLFCSFCLIGYCKPA